MSLSCYECHHCTDIGSEICENAIKCYSIRVHEGHEDGTEYFSKGCIHSGAIDYCKTRLGGKSTGQLQTKCCQTSLCNNETMEDVIYQNEALKSFPPNYWLIATVVAAAVGFIVLIAGTIWWSKRSKKRSNNRNQNNRPERNQPVSIPLMETSVSQSPSRNNEIDHLIATAAGDSTLREVFDHSITSGSGSGLPQLIPRTLSNEIELIETIGQGRFSEVKRGRWQDDNVAVKIYLSREESLFNREREIYNIVMLRHSNILGYIGSDVASASSCTQLRLVLHYHPLGSLYDFLTEPNFCSPISDIILILRSAISGITHLHTEIFGTQGKPAIGHRDIKSKNIYLKNPTTACIGDFGLAVTHIHSNNSVNIGNPNRIGSIRYAAPEVLDQSIKADVFESYKMADIYSFALVMWESCQRAAIVGEEDYRQPYHDEVSSDPSIEEMKKVVAVGGIRPTFPESWTQQVSGQYSPMPTLIDLMEQSWNPKPESRLTALNIKKKLDSLASLVCKHDE